MDKQLLVLQTPIIMVIISIILTPIIIVVVVDNNNNNNISADNSLITESDAEVFTSLCTVHPHITKVQTVTG